MENPNRKTEIRWQPGSQSWVCPYCGAKYHRKDKPTISFCMKCKGEWTNVKY